MPRTKYHKSGNEESFSTDTWTTEEKMRILQVKIEIFNGVQGKWTN